MNREELKQLIRDSIHAVAHERVRELGVQNKNNSTTNYLNSTEISEDDFDETFFYGGHKKKDEKKTGPITIKEGVDTNLRITTGEIKEFENSFEDILSSTPGASIVFDKQPNNYSILATKRADGVEAKASGIINLGDNGKIIWSYSILNGCNLNAQNLKLTQENKAVFEALFNHYNDWQKKWREKLNLPTSQQNNDGGMQPTDALAGGENPMPNMPPVTGPGVSGAGAGAGVGSAPGI